MNYTVVGLFPNQEAANDASRRLVAAGFPETDHSVSAYRAEGDYAGEDYDYEEDERTSSFWDRLFGSDDNYDRKAYSYAGSRNVLVTVYANDKDRADKAAEIMDEAGAISVDDHLPETFNKYQEYNERRGVANTSLDNSTEKIQVVNEEMNVGKREVETGGIRVRSRVIEKPVEENIRLKEERVYIKRNPVNREITNADAAFQNSSINVSQSREIPVVEKTARVVEEIEVGKEVQHTQETVTGTVRETQVDVEDTTQSHLANNNIVDNQDKNRI